MFQFSAFVCQYTRDRCRTLHCILSKFFRQRILNRAQFFSADTAHTQAPPGRNNQFAFVVVFHLRQATLPLDAESTIRSFVDNDALVMRSQSNTSRTSFGRALLALGALIMLTSTPCSIAAQQDAR